jgi:hypothetical protein
MNKTLLITLIIALSLLEACTAAAQSLNSTDELEAYLDQQPANSPDKPIKVAMKINENMIMDIVEVIWESGKYVSLDLSGSPLTTIPDGAFAYCAAITGITMPNNLTSIGWAVFSDCTNIASITIPKSVTNVGAGAFWGWTASQTINIQGKADREATIAAGWYSDIWGEWDDECEAQIVYRK